MRNGLSKSQQQVARVRRNYLSSKVTPQMRCKSNNTSQIGDAGEARQIANRRRSSETAPEDALLFAQH
jgi:hypothetical protein